MTTIGYIFLDEKREKLTPLEEQRQALNSYAQNLNMSCDELLIEQAFSLIVPLADRIEGRKMLENVQRGDTILVMQAKWVLGTRQNALSLIKLLKEKEVSLFCIDLDGDISMPTQRKLVSSQGISEIVYQVIESLSLEKGGGNHSAAIRAGKARLKLEGKFTGGPIPFGWKVSSEGKLEKDEEQQELITEMIGLKADRWSYRDIASKMQEQKKLSLSHEGIRRILNKNKRQMN